MPFSSIHYFPLALPFLLLLLFLFTLLVILIEIHIIEYAYKRMGINHRYIFALLLLSLLGSYVNIPVAELSAGHVLSGRETTFFGIRYVVPLVERWPGTVIALNVGGAIIPVLLSLYLLVKNRLYGRGLIGVAVVTVIVHMTALPVKGVGIGVPIFVPPLAAASVGLILSRRFAPPLAYIAGSLGTLIGADLLNLGEIQRLGAPIASIGGAGTFDAIFLTGILAVLLAGLFTPKSRGR